MSRYQDGTTVHGEEITLVHATRPDFIASIMLHGPRTSNESHRVVGLWCRQEDASGDESYDWGRTPLDKFSGCVVHLKTPSEKDNWYLLTGKNRLGGRGERALVKGKPESTEIPIRVVSVTFRIPSISLDFWREKLRTCLSMCVDYHGNHLEDGTKAKAKKHLWALVANQLSYDRHGAWPTGRWNRVNKMSYFMALEVFGALRPLWFPETEKKKKKEFGTRVWEHLPVPFQRFLEEEHPEICEHFDPDPTADPDGLYCVTGDEIGPDRSEDQTEKPVRVWAFKQPLWVQIKKTQLS